MIKKCIEFEKVKNAIMGQPPDLHYPSWYMSLIEQLPLINIEENNKVKEMNDMEIASILYKDADAIKGKWIGTDTKFGIRLYHCSECKADLMQLSLTNFCPNCGMKMEGEA